MAHVKAQGTQVFTVIDNQVVRFVCYKKIDLGQDSFQKIEINCMDDDTTDFERGRRTPGEGSIQIDYDDENISHARLLEIADSGEKLDWYIGGSQSKIPPAYDVLTGIDLPEDRTWWSYRGYLNDATPVFEQDQIVNYSFPLVRTSKVTTTPRVVTP